MLGFRKKIENDKLNIQEQNIESSISYSDDNWIQDLNKSHEFSAGDENFDYNEKSFDKQNDNSQFVNQSIFSDYQGLNENTNIIENLEFENKAEKNIEKTDKKKKIELSTRLKIHLTIYTCLVLFVFSMIISNAVLTNISKNLISAAENSYEIIEKENISDSITLPDGSKVKVEKTKKQKYKNINTFDKICDTLEGK